MKNTPPTISSPNVDRIVNTWLIANGYDGLWNDEGCGCSVEDLAPCGDINGSCTAGYKVAGCTCGDGCAFHIVPEKP